MEVLMSANMCQAIRGCSPVDGSRRREEIERILNAIAGAIVTGRLPPDDACAWARIAASEVRMLGVGEGFTLVRGES
jgi:hypothetical protein